MLKNRQNASSFLFLSIGWGATVPGPNRSTILRQAKMPVVDYKTCSKGNSWFQPVDDTSMVCAGYGGDSKVSGCNGDSGGPFVCEEGGKWILRGAVSWGDPKCRAGSTYSVFARISSFVDWIQFHTTTKHVDLIHQGMFPTVWWGRGRGGEGTIMVCVGGDE